MTFPTTVGCLSGARLLALALALAGGPAAAQEGEAVGADLPTPEPAQAPDTKLPAGKASWYGPRFHGRRTSSGERFDMNALTAAHGSLPFGTRVRVRNEVNGREVIVRINDRLPKLRGRIIDLSKAAAAALGIVERGEAAVVLFEHRGH